MAIDSVFTAQWATYGEDEPSDSCRHGNDMDCQTCKDMFTADAYRWRIASEAARGDSAAFDHPEPIGPGVV